ncbi:hypothetical protein BS78_01G221000 [Paspalum vaginatum]|nr:hypothetical protein BS78_01G221000 [Paspalum vaginatum]KAJ1295403.1 hypothetical protein BS78_01G221000 [Paspalum vaginatum]
MRIRKRTPARAASPGLSASPLLQQPKEKPEPQEDNKADEDGAEQQQQQEEEEEEEEKRVVLVDPAPAAAAAARCSRNDGKRWRCKAAAAPGYLFCHRHVAWSTRKRRPRPAKKTLTSRGGAEDGTGCRKRAEDGAPGSAA